MPPSPRLAVLAGNSPLGSPASPPPRIGQALEQRVQQQQQQQQPHGGLAPIAQRGGGLLGAGTRADDLLPRQTAHTTDGAAAQPRTHGGGPSEVEGLLRPELARIAGPGLPHGPPAAAPPPTKKRGGVLPPLKDRVPVDPSPSIVAPSASSHKGQPAPARGRGRSKSSRKRKAATSGLFDRSAINPEFWEEEAERSRLFNWSKYFQALVMIGGGGAAFVTALTNSTHSEQPWCGELKSWLLVGSLCSLVIGGVQPMAWVNLRAVKLERGVATGKVTTATAACSHFCSCCLCQCCLVQLIGHARNNM